MTPVISRSPDVMGGTAVSLRIGIAPADDFKARTIAIAKGRMNVKPGDPKSDMVFNCRQLVSYISRYFTLKPGDIIFTGTPEGVISGYPKEKQVWLKPGDVVTTSIEKLGDLEFKLT